MKTIEDVSQKDLQIFYFDVLKSKYLQIKSMLQKEKDIYTCYEVVNFTNQRSIDICKALLDTSLQHIDVQLNTLEEFHKQRLEELKKEISKTITTPLC